MVYLRCLKKHQALFARGSTKRRRTKTICPCFDKESNGSDDSSSDQGLHQGGLLKDLLIWDIANPPLVQQESSMSNYRY